jgi:hypothetical protein
MTSTNGSIKTGNAEVYGYNVITDQDHDILNQGSVHHIQKYFDAKQKEEELKAMGINNGSYIITQNLSAVKAEYSINSVSFILKIVIFIIFMWIVCDFIKK